MSDKPIAPKIDNDVKSENINKPSTSSTSSTSSKNLTTEQQVVEYNNDLVKLDKQLVKVWGRYM